jgi:hypothetical protein
MTWLTWRQLRLQGSAVLAVLAALALALLLTAHGLRADYRASASTFIDQLQFHRLDSFLYLAGLVTVHSVAPVIGAFWGAPLIAREIEAGTHRLVWNQSVSRSRWLATKLAVVGAVAVLGTGVVAAVVTGWSRPIDRAVAAGHGSGTFSLPRIDPVVFGARGIVVLGYVLFAIAVGVTVGLLLRRSIPAIAVTLLVVSAAEILVPHYVRPHLVAPVARDVVINTENLRGVQIQGAPGERPDGPVRIQVRAGGPGDWSLTNSTVNGAGSVSTVPISFSDCFSARLAPPVGLRDKARAGGRNSIEPCFARLAAAGYRQHVTYQPARNFWALQLTETGLLLVLAGLLTGVCFWRINRDVS